MTIKLANNVSGFLNTAITASDTGIVLQSGNGASFPALGAGEYFYATLVSTGGTLEVVKVTARSGDSMTVVRAQDNSSAASFAAGSRVEMRINAQAVLDVVDQVTASQVGFTPVGGIAATDVQAALTELDSEAAKSATLAASGGSALVGFLQSGSGAQARTAQSKMRDVVSVFDFMTSAQIADVQARTYSVDVSGAVQAAIDANATQGAYLWFPSGLYRFDSGVTLPVNSTAKWVFESPQNTVIRTSNAITLLSRNPVDQTSALNTIKENTVIIRNLTFQGSQVSGQVGVNIGSTYGALVDDCHFFALDKGLIFRFGLKAVIRNCFFTLNVTESIVLRHGDWSGASTINSQSNACSILSCRVFNRTGATSSIAILASSDVSIRDSVIEGQSPVYGVYFDALFTTPVKNVLIDNCHLECVPAPTAAAFYFKGTGGLAVVRGLYAQVAAGAGAYLIDNSDWYGSPMQVHLVDTPWLTPANPSGYLFKTRYPAQWVISGDVEVFSNNNAVRSSLFDTSGDPLDPVVLVTGGNSGGGPAVGVRAYGALNLRASTSVNLTAATSMLLSASSVRTRIENGGVRIDINNGSSDIDLVCTLLRINGTVGATGTFTTADGKTVTVTKGLTTSIV
jgi:hypothetical protein